jgi:hypothetical protein
MFAFTDEPFINAGVVQPEKGATVGTPAAAMIKRVPIDIVLIP